MHFIKIFFVILISISININSQEFDENFLSSLPENVRNDLLKKEKDRLELQEPVYRNQSSALDKEDEVQNKNMVYGANFFTTFQSTFMPINEPNFDANYILDYGDVLNIQLIGQKNLLDTYKISRNGSINLPDIGKINISGLSLNDANKLIQAKVKESFIGTEAFINLESIRDVNVMIAGNVFNSGVYTLSGNSNALHALVMAGGIDDQGSYREIKLKRNNETIEIIDIYDYLIFGNSSNLARLRSGDLIFVERSKNIVSVNGAVKRPMLYELKDSETFNDLLNFSNGTEIYADISYVFIDRFDDGGIKRISVNSLEDLKKISVRDKDNLYIGDYKLREVYIDGAVQNTGFYLLNEGDGIFDLISRAGGYTERAYPFGGVLENERARIVNQEANQLLYKKLLSQIIDLSSLSSSDNDLNSIIMIADSIRDEEVSGRVNAEFNLELIKDNPKLDTALHDGDKITIPELMNHIYVFGEVANTGTVTFDKNKDVYAYISDQGGFTDISDKKNIFVVYTNGKSIKISSRKKIFTTQFNSKLKIYPGTIIFVPRKINNALVRSQTLQAYTSILGNLGVSLASISVLKD